MASKRSFLILCILCMLPVSCMLKKDCVSNESSVLSAVDQISRQNETIEKLTYENNRLRESRNRCRDLLAREKGARPQPADEPDKSDAVSKIEKLKRQNKELEEIREGLTSKINSLKFEIKKRDSIIAIQEGVIQLLDDTKKTIETSLKEQIAKKLFEIEATQNQVKMVFRDTILFRPGSLDINERGKKLLLKIAASVKAKKGQHIRVEGHSDKTPARSYATNWELSADRALAVVRFLHEVAGCDPSTLSAVVYGSSRPLATNDTEEGRRQNRRIELVIHYPKPIE